MVGVQRRVPRLGERVGERDAIQLKYEFEGDGGGGAGEVDCDLIRSGFVHIDVPNRLAVGGFPVGEIGGVWCGAAAF